MKKNDAISRSALMDAALERLTIGKRVNGVLVLRETITAQELDTLLTAAPALDVQPVVHARWIYTGEVDYDNNHPANCSHCGARDDHKEELINKVPYCWNCGARMDAEEGA